MEYATLFVEIADAYFERDMYMDARHVYDTLGADERVCSRLKLSRARVNSQQTSSMYVLLQAAACRRMTGDLDEAAKVYEHGELFYFTCPLYRADSARFIAIKADPENNDAKMKLAEIYEILNDPRRALELVTQGTKVVTSRL